MQRNRIQHDTIYNDVQSEHHLRRKVWYAGVEHAHHDNCQTRNTVVSPHGIQERADACRNVHDKRSNEDGCKTQNGAKGLGNLDVFCIVALFFADCRQNVQRKQCHCGVEHGIKGGQDGAEHGSCEEAQNRLRQNGVDENRIRLVKDFQRAAVHNILNDAWAHQKQRAEYAQEACEQSALLTFRQVLGAQGALNDGLVGAPVGYMVDAASNDNHRPRNVRRLCIVWPDGVQMIRRCG